MYYIYCLQVRNKYVMFGYAYNIQKMELIIIEEGSVIRRLFVGSRMCGEYIMIICVGRVKGFMYMGRESERFNVYVQGLGRVKCLIYMCRASERFYVYVQGEEWGSIYIKSLIFVMWVVINVLLEILILQNQIIYICYIFIMNLLGYFICIQQYLNCIKF